MKIPAISRSNALCGVLVRKTGIFPVSHVVAL
nr:MAG TPA: hypothetical protein [Caudoviricetes sp.]